MECSELLRLQAYFDGELDALGTLAVEEHLAQCGECTQRRAEWEQLRAALRQVNPMEAAPAALRARIERCLDQETRQPPAVTRPTWRIPWPTGLSVLFGGAGGAILASLAMLLWFVPSRADLLDQIVSAHVRSLMPEHLIDVASSDRHTVRPWFAGRTDVSPTVADFAAQGYRLVGGRLDIIEQRRAAVLVYQHGAHTANVFSWQHQGAGLPRQTVRNGYLVDCWQDSALQSCVISDMGSTEQQTLVGLLRNTH
ncbi:MAG: anti-sigma factor [Sinobacteraceae bacterium]|nr:anti-sigma factor [Nevskiaceae bacterium]